MKTNGKHEQAAKQTRWGSLAARLEVQCEDVLSMEMLEDIGSSSGAGEHQQHNVEAGSLVSNGGVGHAPPAPDVHSPLVTGTVARPAPSNPQPHDYLHQLQLQPPTDTAALSKTSVSSLKDWIVTKLVDKEIKEATSPLPFNNTGTNPYEKLHIERCVKIAHLLVAHLAKSFEGTKNNDVEATADSFDGADDWEPKPQDIDEECITVTENSETGDIVDVGFNIYRNFDWDHDAELDADNSPSNEQKLGLIFEALGKLLYKLFMEGEDVPPYPESTDTDIFNKSVDRKNIAIPNEDDILDMLRKLPITGIGIGNGQNDCITSTMRNSGKLPMPLCRLVTDLLHTSTTMQSSNGHTLQSNDEASCFASLSDVHSDVQQMIDFPDAFLHSSINSRWELVFGNNHMFGRKRELQQLMDAAYRIQSNASSKTDVSPPGQMKKEVVMVNGHAGSGKSRLVREIRKPLQAQGWIFLRCKFGKSIHSEPLSVIALGMDEYFSSSVDSSCPRRVCQRLESLIGLDGLKCLSQQMPSLRSLVGEPYEHRREPQEKSHMLHIYGTLLDTLAVFSPVLFFVDDLQWADAASLELLTGLINRTDTNFEGDCSTNRILFVGAYRSDNIIQEVSLKTMIQQFEECDTINTTKISLCGFQLESLNEMVSEALCLPRRKTRPLAQIIHKKTQGFPLFVVEFLDALWTEKLLVHDSANGWDWDVDAIDLKGISKSVAELLAF